MDTNMIIDVDRIPREGMHISKDFDFLGADLVDESAVFLEPAHGELFIRMIGDEIYVKGEIRTRLSLVCSRCLTPYEFPVASRFDLVFLPEDLDEMTDELSDEDVDQMFYRDRRLDVRNIVLEQMNLVFPLKPLCTPECEGICAVCGEIIRDGRCSCLVKEADPRWDKDKIKTIVRDKT